MGEKQCSCNSGTRFKLVPAEEREWSNVQKSYVIRKLNVLREYPCGDCGGSGWLPDEE